MSRSKVLVVEDDDNARFMFTELLEELGIAYEAARDGQECVEIILSRPHDFDTVLMDIHMPVKTGIEACREIRDHDGDPPRNIRIVAVSADGFWHDETVAMGIGFSGTLPKPINFDRVRRLFA